MVGDAMIADDDYKTKWYASNKALHAAWERAEKAEAEVAAQIQVSARLASEAACERLRAEKAEAERDALWVSIKQWRSLYRRAFNCAAGLTNYVEDRPGLRSIEKDMAMIESEARAALKEGE
jgi:hypothetical protein